MPTYEYRCRECGEELEAVQAFTDDPLTECPACGGPLRKKFAAPGIAFKGSGFYKNDSRPSSSSGSSSTGDKGSGDSTGSGDKTGGGKSGGDKASGDKASGGKAGDAAKPAASSSPAPKAASTA